MDFFHMSSDPKRHDYAVRRSADSMLNELQAWGEFSPTSKADVEALAREYLSQGRTKTQSKGQDAVEYFSSFWEADSKYIILKRASGEKISEKYRKNNASVLKRYVKPYFESLEQDERYLSRLTIDTFEDCMLSIYKDTKSESIVNQAKKAMSVPMTEAFNKKLIADNPMKYIKGFKERDTEKDVFTLDEAKKVLQPEWWSDERCRVINMLAASSGLRIGECLGLRRP